VSATYKQDVLAETVIKSRKTRDYLAGLIQEYTGITETISSLEKAKKERGAEIESLANTLGINFAETKVRFPGVGSLSQTVRVTKSIAAHKLLSHGVSQDVIEASTDVRESRYFQPRAEKVKDGETGDES
jgi:hypothetical protein